MKVDRFIFMLDGNPNYNGFWNISSKWHSENFGVIPTLIFFGKEEEAEKLGLSKQFGEIIYLENHAEFILDSELNWTITWAQFYGATLFPEDVCMTLGLDQFILNYDFFKYIKPFDQDSFVIGYSEAYKDTRAFGERSHCDRCLFPSAYVAAKGKVIKDLLSVEDDWYQELKRAYDASKKYVNPLVEKYRAVEEHELDKYYLGEIDKLPPPPCGIPEDTLWGLDEAFYSDLICNLPPNKKDKVILGKFWTADGGVPRKRIERETEHVASLARCESTKAGRRKAIFVDAEGVPIGKQRFYETFHGYAMTRDILPLTRQGWFVEMHCMRPWMQPAGKNLTLNKALPLTHSSVPKPKRLMDWLNSKGEKLTHELMTLLILSEAQQYLKEHKDEVL